MLVLRNNSIFLQACLTEEQYEWLDELTLFFNKAEKMRFRILEELQSPTIYIDFTNYLLRLNFNEFTDPHPHKFDFWIPTELANKLNNFITNIREMNYTCARTDFFRFIIQKKIRFIRINFLELQKIHLAWFYQLQHITLDFQLQPSISRLEVIVKQPNLVRRQKNDERRRKKQAILLEILESQGPCTCSQLARKSHLSAGTVFYTLKDLIDQELVSKFSQSIVGQKITKILYQLL